MNRCRARLPLGSKPTVQPGPFGFPESVTIHCNQSVGVKPVRGGYACPIPGHAADVEAQALRWGAMPTRQDLRQRARLEFEEDERANAFIRSPE